MPVLRITYISPVKYVFSPGQRTKFGETQILRPSLKLSFSLTKFNQASSKNCNAVSISRKCYSQEAENIKKLASEKNVLLTEECEW